MRSEKRRQEKNSVISAEVTLSDQIPPFEGVKIQARRQALAREENVLWVLLGETTAVTLPFDKNNNNRLRRVAEVLLSYKC
jgi:hypothetical protein